MKTVIITGASKGLGLAISQTFFKEGWQVIGTGRSERPKDLDQAIHYHQFDASDNIACENFWAEIKELLDGEVCLVNNAGSYVSGSLLDTTADDYEKQMDSSYFSSVYMTRGIARTCDRAKIVNIVSSSALAAHARNSAYGAAKAATMHFFQSLQEEYSVEKYAISNIYPENIATHGTDPSAVDPTDLAMLILEVANNSRTYYLKDVSVYPTSASGGGLE